MLQVKTVSYDGVEFNIGELSLKQVEDFFGSGKEAVVLDVIISSLNNALKDGDTAWTRDRAMAELGSRSFNMLKKDVLEFSDVTLKKPGEALAAS